MRRRNGTYRLLAFMTLVGIAGAAVWKYDLLPIEFGSAPSGEIDDSEVSIADVDSNEVTVASSDEINIEIFESQSEPLVESNSDVQTKASRGSLDAWLNSDSESAISNHATSSSQQIQQTSNEKVEAPEKPRKVATTTGTNKTPRSSDLRKQLAAIDGLLQEGKDVAAHRQLSQIYWKHPEARAGIRKKIEETARSIYFSPQPHYVAPYVIQPGDQLRKIATTYKITWPYLAKLNRIDPRRIRAGQKLKVIKGPFSAFVDLSDYELVIHAHGYFVKRYSVGIGKEGSSPVGKFRVLNKVTNPQYTDPQGRVIDGDDPNNPLGEHWVDIGDGFGIHGTIHPDSIGKDQSRGCIRLVNSDVAEVYNFLMLDSEVIIRR